MCKSKALKGSALVNTIEFGGAVSISSDLSDLKSCFSLSDAWRALHPRVRQFMWFNSVSFVSSRLDTFLWQEVSFHLLGRVIFPHVFFSDHEYVFIDLVLKDSSKFGPGEWKLNNSLLEDKSFCAKIRALIFL